MMTDRQNRWLVFVLIWGFAILVLVAAAVLIAPRVAHGQCPPGSSSCCPPIIGAGVFGPQGGWVGARAGGGRGIQAGVGGPYGGVVGAQVGPGARVQAGVIPGQGRPSAGVQRIPSTVKMESDGGTFTRHGTGTLIDVLPDEPGNPWLILTCAHILTDSPTAIVEGQRVALRVIAIDAIRDVALLERAEYRPIVARGMPLLQQAPSVAGWQGFAEGRRLVGGGGPVLRDGDKICIPGQAPEGTSGGPIYGPNGLASVITETNDQGTGRWVTAGPATEWLYAWVMAHVSATSPTPLPYTPPADPATTGNDSPGSIPVPTPGAGADHLPPRPVVSVQQFNEVKVTVEAHSGDIDKLTAYVQGQTRLNEEIQERLMQHSEALADHDGRLANHEGRITALEDLPAAEPVDLAGIEARLAALEAGLQRPIGFVDFYMQHDPNGPHEYMGRKYSLRDQKQETVTLGQTRVTYYYPLEQSEGSVAPANP